MSQTKNRILTTTIIAILNVSALSAANEDPCKDFLTIFERGQFDSNYFRNQKIQAEHPDEQKATVQILKPCISYCCLRGQVLFHENPTCKSLLPGSYHVTMHPNETNEFKKQRDILDKFATRTGEQCKEIPYWQPGSPFGIFFKTLTMNIANNSSRSGELCVSLQFNLQWNLMVLQLHTQTRIQEQFGYLIAIILGKRDQFKNYVAYVVMLSSVPLLIVTIMVFSMVPDANMSHNKSFRCYLGSLCIAFTTLSVINLSDNLSDSACWHFGYTTYFGFIASYSWLCVISYNLFSSVEKVPDSFTENKNFIIYSIFGWGFPILCYGITSYAQGATWIDADLKPNIGFNNHCFFERKGTARFIYYCGLRMVLVSFDIIMFILTLRKIRHALIPKTWNKKSHFEKSGMVARLSLVMGLSWVFEMVACAFSDRHIFDYLFIFISIQGHLIFILFVLKKNIREKLKDRYRKSVIFDSNYISTPRS